MRETHAYIKEAAKRAADEAAALSAEAVQDAARLLTTAVAGRAKRSKRAA